MSYLIYGKREEDKTFKALDWNGNRVKQLPQAFEFAEKSDAQERLDSVILRPGAKFEIRKAP